MITAEGIVLKERDIGEQDKFIDILTREGGVLEASVKGARKINGRSGSSTQLFAYSRFCLNPRGDRLFLNSAEPIHIFYGLRESLSRIALASYFSEVLRFCIDHQKQDSDILRLMLNSLHYLEKGLRNEALLKAIFELRLMSETGFMPDVVACRGCGAYEPDEVCFSVNDGFFYCADCFGDRPDAGIHRFKLPVLSAVRHIVLADHDRLFNFRVSENALSKLSAFAEDYILSRLERSFKTLDFYKSVAGGNTQK